MKMSNTIYCRLHGDTRARTVSLKEASADIRANGEPALTVYNGSDLWPWLWLGLLYAGHVVKTQTADYALEARFLR